MTRLLLAQGLRHFTSPLIAAFDGMAVGVPMSPSKPEWLLAVTRRNAVFSQLAIIILAVFLVGMGLREGDYLNVGLGILVGAFAANTLHKLKTGK